MNKILAITTITLIAVIMVMGTVSPAMAGHDKGKDKSQDDNVAICHNGNIIWVSENAVEKHLDHGDTLAPCNSD